MVMVVHLPEQVGKQKRQSGHGENLSVNVIKIRRAHLLFET